MRGGAGLKSAETATTVRVSADGRTVHDGPFAETREQLGGFYLIDVPDLDAAIAQAVGLERRLGQNPGDHTRVQRVGVHLGGHRRRVPQHQHHGITDGAALFLQGKGIFEHHGGGEDRSER